MMIVLTWLGRHARNGHSADIGVDDRLDLDEEPAHWALDGIDQEAGAIAEGRWIEMCEE